MAVERIDFDSITALIRYLDDVPRRDTAGTSSTDEGRSNDWDLGIGYAGAAEIARNGGYWEEGATLLQRGVAQAARLVEYAKAPALEYAVAGFAPDVPTYLAGVPDHMLTVADSGMDGAKPTLSICVPNAAGGVDAGDILNRGIAVATLVDVLESGGYRVEVWTQLGCTNDTHTLDARVCIKRAAEQWSPSAMAFGMGHPAMIRRLGFAVRERFAICDSMTRHGGYGRGEVFEPESFTLAMPRLRGSYRSPWATLEGALEATETLARNAGIAVTLTKRGAA